MVLILLATLAVPGGPSTAYFAEHSPSGAVLLSLRQGDTALPVPGAPEDAEWRRWGLRRTSPSPPLGVGGVFEIDREAPRLQVRTDYQLFAYSGLTVQSSGIGLVGSRGLQLLFSAADDRYRLLLEGAALSPDADRLGIVLKGVDEETVHVLRLDPGTVSVTAVIPQEPIDKVEPRSIAVTSAAVFFGAERGNELYVFRAPLSGSGLEAEVSAERIAGPFKDLEKYFSASPAGVAFLAGDSGDKLDVFVARNQGAPVNVTQAPGRVLPHRPDDQRIALSDDGSLVAFDRHLGGEPETYLQEVGEPGGPAAFQITADQRFNPYIDQESLIFFDASGRLLFAGGHDVVTTDLYRVNPSDPTTPINLTRTGSGLNAPFLTKGTLQFNAAFRTSAGLIVSAATGYASDPTRAIVTALDPTSGTIYFAESSLTAPADFVAVGGEVAFVASPPEGGRALYQILGTELVQVAVATPGTEPRVLLGLPGAVYAGVPGTGILRLEMGGSSLVLPDAGSPTTAALDSTGKYLALGDPAAGRYLIVELATGEAAAIAAGAGGQLLAVAEAAGTFLRGDSNVDGLLDVSDAVATLFYLFLGEATVPCLDAADSDDNGLIQLTDVVRLLDYLFRGGAVLEPPFTAPGIDPTPDGLDCAGG